MRTSHRWRCSLVARRTVCPVPRCHPSTPLDHTTCFSRLPGPKEESRKLRQQEEELDAQLAELGITFASDAKEEAAPQPLPGLGAGPLLIDKDDLTGGGTGHIVAYDDIDWSQASKVLVLARQHALPLARSAGDPAGGARLAGAQELPE